MPGSLQRASECGIAYARLGADPCGGGGTLSEGVLEGDLRGVFSKLIQLWNGSTAKNFGTTGFQTFPNFGRVSAGGGLEVRKSLGNFGNYFLVLG